MTTSQPSSFAIRGVATGASRLGLGGAPTGGHGWGARDDAAAASTIQAAIDGGINFFDTADVYGLGLAETILGNVIAAMPGMRDALVLATKGGVAWDTTGRTRRDGSPKHLRNSLETSLRRLRTDCVDLYYLHWPDSSMAIDDSVGALTEFRSEGKVKAIGVCNIAPQQLRQLRWAALAAVQVKGNLLEPQELISISDAAHDMGASVICSSALADGLLSGTVRKDTRFGPDDHRSRYPLFQPGAFEQSLEHVSHLIRVSNSLSQPPAVVALRWLLQSGYADAVLTGSISSRHITDNIRCLWFEIPSAEMQELQRSVPLEGPVPLKENSPGGTGARACPATTPLTKGDQ